jgi:hypothetical protein
MPYCGHCGVQVDDTVRACPLCAGALQAERPTTLAPYPAGPAVPALPPLTWAYRRAFILNTVSVLSASALLAVFFVDMFADSQLEWSLLCLPPIAAGWCAASLCLHLYRHPWLLHLGLVGTTGLLLLLIDLVNGRLEWFTTLATPILLASFVAVGLALAGARWRRTSWALGLAIAGIAVTLFCLFLDCLLAYHAGRGAFPSWSLVVWVTLVPPELFFVYVHVRLRKQVDLAKVFHL